MKLEDIKSVKVHWSESELINNAIGCDDSGDIEKEITPIEADKLIKDAAKTIRSGYDKTFMTIRFNGEKQKQWLNVKFYITGRTTSLVKLISP